MVKGFSCTGGSAFPMGGVFVYTRLRGGLRGMFRRRRRGQEPRTGAQDPAEGPVGFGVRKEDFAQAGTSVKPSGQQCQVIFGFGASWAIVVSVDTRGGGGVRLQNFAKNLLGRARAGG